MKIRRKLTLAFLGIAILVAGVGYFAAVHSQQILEKYIANHFLTLAADVLEEPVKKFA